MNVLQAAGLQRSGTQKRTVGVRDLDALRSSAVALLFAASASCARSTAFKVSSLFPEGEEETHLARLRLGVEGEFGPSTVTDFAYELRARSNTAAGASGLVVLPPDIKAPFRIEQLDDEISDSDADISARHEIDRAFAAFRTGWGEVTVGRQAIGFGRGVMFSAVDVFAPFSPFEVDREWRRGVDAVRADVKISDTYSLDLIAAFAESLDESALLWRVRGYTGNADGEVILGKRGEDVMYAGTFSAAVAEAEVHGELALFGTPEVFPDGGLFGGDDLVAKAVLGASYTFAVGTGLTVFGEYHYSGFGNEDVADSVVKLIADPAYAARLVRGDMQMLGRRAVALRASYTFAGEWMFNLMWTANADDSSGLVAPALTWDISDSAAATVSAYFPYGRGLVGPTPMSEYGASPTTAFLQLRFYF